MEQLKAKENQPAQENSQEVATDKATTPDIETENSSLWEGGAIIMGPLSIQETRWLYPKHNKAWA